MTTSEMRDGIRDQLRQLGIGVESVLDDAMLLGEIRATLAVNFQRGLLPPECNEPDTLHGKLMALIEYAYKAYKATLEEADDGLR